MQARLDELTCREVVARYLRPLQARVWRDAVANRLVIEGASSREGQPIQRASEPVRNELCDASVIEREASLPRAS